MVCCLGLKEFGFDTIFLRIHISCPCKAWPTETPPTDGLGFPLNATNFEDIIKDGASLQCTDSRGAACGSFWVYDLDDLEDP